MGEKKHELHFIHLYELHSLRLPDMLNDQFCMIETIERLSHFPSTPDPRLVRPLFLPTLRKKDSAGLRRKFSFQKHLPYLDKDLIKC